MLIFTLNYGSEHAFDRVMADWLPSKEACVELAKQTVPEWENVEVYCVSTAWKDL